MQTKVDPEPRRPFHRELLSWTRLGALLAVVTVGGSQILFNLILQNRAYFPRSPGFHLWVLIWAQILPFAALLAVDAFFAGAAGPDARGPRLWRAFLYALTAALLLRQAQVHYGRLIFPRLGGGGTAFLFLAAPAAVGVAAWFRRKDLDRYFGLLGVLALILTALYLRGVLAPAAASGPAATASLPAAPGRPVVLIVFDELSVDALLDREGGLDRATFPRLAALADEGAWFTDATSNSPRTEPSMLSLLTGHFQPKDEDPLLFQRMRESHRATVQMAWPVFHEVLRAKAGPGDLHLGRVHAEAMRLGPLDTLGFLGAAMSESPFLRADFLAPVPEDLTPPDLWDLWGGRDIFPVEVDTFLGQLRGKEMRGRFLYWHCSLPHGPFRFDAQGRPHGRTPDRFTRRDDPQARQVWENYLDQARGVDRVVGAVVDRMKREGIFEESLLIITSDHGVRTWGALEPAGYPDVQSGLSVRVPLLMRGPSIPAGLRRGDYQHIDFAPTLLDVLGIAYDARDFDGVSAFGGEKPAREKAFRLGDARYVLDRARGEWKRTRTP